MSSKNAPEVHPADRPDIPPVLTDKRGSYKAAVSTDLVSTVKNEIIHTSGIPDSKTPDRSSKGLHSPSTHPRTKKPFPSRDCEEQAVAPDPISKPFSENEVAVSLEDSGTSPFTITETDTSIGIFQYQERPTATATKSSMKDTPPDTTHIPGSRASSGAAPEDIHDTHGGLVPPTSLRQSQQCAPGTSPSLTTRPGSSPPPPHRAPIGGAAGATTVSSSSIRNDLAGIVITDHRQDFKAAVLPSTASTTAKEIAGCPGAPRHPESDIEVEAEEIPTGKPPARRSLLRKLGHHAAREIERAAVMDGNVDDRTAGMGIKYGFRAGKTAAVGLGATMQGTYGLAAYGKQLSIDVKSGLTTAPAARAALLTRTKESAQSVPGNLASIIKTTTRQEIEDFYGSDDLGMQAITKPKDAVIYSKRTLDFGRATGHTLVKSWRVAQTAYTKTTQAARAIVAAGKRAIANPVILKGLAFIAPACAAFMLIPIAASFITSIFSVFSIKSEDWELTQTYLYITELDARMEDDILSEDQEIHIPGVDVYTYYLNGLEVAKLEMNVYTDADLLLMYLDSKYDDYSFRDVKEEIQEIHNELHQLSTNTWVERVEIDPVTVQFINHMDISLSTQTTSNYFTINSNLMTPEEQEKYDALEEVGAYSMRQELSSPFPGVDWLSGVTSRFGWRIHPITGELSTHNALDIAMAGGTPIAACNGGTALVPAFNSSYGNYVKVIAPSGDYTLYAHMSSIAVTSGQEISPGDVIGYVGTTGSSTGNHLHLEYWKDGHGLNPLFYVER